MTDLKIARGEKKDKFESENKASSSYGNKSFPRRESNDSDSKSDSSARSSRKMEDPKMSMSNKKLRQEKDDVLAAQARSEEEIQAVLAKEIRE